MTGLLRLSLLICGGLLIFLSAALTDSRSNADGAYWLISPRDEYNASGLYVQEPDDGQRHMLRGFDESMTLMWWSVDQKWLYFRTVEAFDADFYALNLFRMRLGGRQRECVGRKLARLGAASLSDFTPSPDTEWVAYATPEWEPNRLYITRGNCFNPNPVFSSQTEIVDSLFWSPDGDWLYFHTQDEVGVTSRLYRVRPDGSGLELLTHTRIDPNETEKTWQWSPDGAWVLLRACGLIDVDFYIICSFHTFRVDDGAASQIGANSLVSSHVVWTADSQWIIHNEETDRSSGVDIFRSSPDGSIIENLTRLPGNERLYGFTPDGQWLLFGASEADSPALRRMRSDGSQEQIIFELSLLPDNIVVMVDGSDSWIYVVDYDSNEQIATLYRLQPDGSDVQPLVTGGFIRNSLRVSPGGEHLLTGYGGQTYAPPLLWLFRMNLDGSQQEHIPLEIDYSPTQFSPLFNMPWRVGWLLLVSAGMLALGGAFRAILTKVPALFVSRKTTKRISANEN